MKRKTFIKSLGLLVIAPLIASKTEAAEILSSTLNAGSGFKRKIAALIKGLKNEGSNLVKKIMNGKKYVFDPYTHYPKDGGIKDEKTGCQIFFHIHRDNEFGHFHTFGLNENGELVHLILISMNGDGEPIGIATVNRWVTGDTYVRSEVLKNLADSFYIDPNLYFEPRVIEFINSIFKAFKDEIAVLFDERDKWIHDYAAKYYREPFEDRDFEVLSYKQISITPGGQKDETLD